MDWISIEPKYLNNHYASHLLEAILGVCRKRQVKTFMRAQGEESTLIPKDYFYIDLLVEKLSKKGPSHITEVIEGKYAEADA